MKKTLFTLIAIITTFAIFSQKSKAWLELGIKGGGGISLILNNNLWNDKSSCAPSLSPCYSYGIRAAVNLNENHQLSIEGLSMQQSQDITFRINMINYEKRIIMQGNNLVMTYRFNSDNGGFVELGGQLSIIKKATETYLSQTIDVKNNYTNYTSGVFSFGGNIAQSNSFTWTVGFRITYSLTDAISASGGQGQQFSYPLNDPIIRKSYETYKSTKPITIQLISEFNFDLGYLARSNCKRGRVSFLSF